MKSAFTMLCLIRGHVRSRRRSYVDPLDRKQRSYCRRCDAPMLKSWPDGWGMARGGACLSPLQYSRTVATVSG